MQMGLAPKLHQLVEGEVDRVTPQQMAIAAAEDFHIREAILDAASYLGVAAANVVVVADPDLIVLGGGVAEIGDLLTDRVKDVITDRIGMFPTDHVQVVRSHLGEKTGLLGAVALAALNDTQFI